MSETPQPGLRRIGRLTLPHLLMLGFGVVILMGTGLLMLPWATQPGAPPMTLVDALFTATSAVCVTGLVVRDTPHQFSYFGQTVILLLFQIGAIGIISFSNLVFLIAKKNIGMTGRSHLEQTTGLLPDITPRQLLTRTITFVFVVEAVAAALLLLRFARDYPISEALWLSVFHAVSAFCNAGFSLFSNSLMGYVDDWWINFVIGTTVILGGIGFLVVADLWNMWEKFIVGRRINEFYHTGRIKNSWVSKLLLRGSITRMGTDKAGYAERMLTLWNADLKMRHLSLHSKVVLVTTGGLIAIGCVVFFFIEWFNATLPLPLGDHFLAATFLSITSRTAGFNTVDTGLLSNATLLFLMFLMLVGGSPGSTAGGIKVTTFAVLFVLVKSRMRNRPNVEMFDRTLPTEVVGKALATTAGMLVSLFVAVMLLELTENGATPHSEVRIPFIEILFEVVSALGTVGLSTGLTPNLSDPGRVIITVCMYAGRLGPLIVAASLIGRRKRYDYSYPTEKVFIG